MANNPQKIILFEQNHARKNSLKTILSREGYLVFSFDVIGSCLDNMELLDADLMIMGGMEIRKAIPILNALVAIKNRLPLLLISEDANLRQSLDLNQCGHAVVVEAPFEIAVFRAAVQETLINGDKKEGGDATSYLVGNCPELIKIKRKLVELGKLKEGVLITGERGVGKEAVARAIHGASKRDAKRFIKIDATELNGDKDFSLLSALKRTIPDITAGKKLPVGENQQRWTIYLDEVGALPNQLQSELLLISGANNDRFKIVAGTSQDMGTLVNKGLFRKDLYYRLNVFQAALPPLRLRRPDIPLLTDFLSYKFSREFEKVCLPVSGKLKSMFMQYDWPGNVSELQGVVRRALLKGEQNIIFSNMRPKGRQRAAQGNSSADKSYQEGNIWTRELDTIEQMTLKKEYLSQVGELDLRGICWNFMARVEKIVMKRALESTNWNRKKAAAMLHISYKSMLNKIKHYGLT